MKKGFLFLLAALLLIVPSAYAQFNNTAEEISFTPGTFGYLTNWGDSDNAVEDMLNNLDYLNCGSSRDDGIDYIMCASETDTEIDIYTYAFYNEALIMSGVVVGAVDQDSMELNSMVQELIDAYNLTDFDTYDILGTGIDEIIDEATDLDDDFYSAGTYNRNNFETFDFSGNDIDEIMDEADELDEYDYMVGANDLTIAVLGAIEGDKDNGPIVLLQFFDRNFVESKDFRRITD